MNYILFIYLLIKSHFLGLLNTKLIIFLDVPLFLLVDLFLLIFIIKKLPLLLRRLKILKIKIITIQLLLFLIFYLLYSFFSFNSTLKDIITNFSDLWSILIFYFLIISNIDRSQILKIITFFCVSISIFYVFHILFGISFGTYQKIDNIDNGRIPLVFNMFFPLFFSFVSFKYLKNNKYILLLILTPLIFVLLWSSGFRSLGFTIPLILFLNILSRYYIRNSIGSLLVQYFGLVIFIGLIIYIPYFSNFSNDVAIKSRIFINQERIEIFSERPMLGYGFIGKDSEVGLRIEDNSTSRFNSTIKLIDAGYLDLLLRFGSIGALIYLYIFLKLSKFKFILNMMSESDTYILGLIIVNLTLSVFSFSVGIVPFFIASYLNMINKKINK